MNLLKCVHHLILADRERQLYAAFICGAAAYQIDLTYFAQGSFLLSAPASSAFLPQKPGLHRALSIRAYFRTAWLPPAPVSHRGAGSVHPRSDGSAPGPACSSHLIVTASPRLIQISAPVLGSVEKQSSGIPSAYLWLNRSCSVWMLQLSQLQRWTYSSSPPFTRISCCSKFSPQPSDICPERYSFSVSSSSASNLPATRHFRHAPELTAAFFHCENSRMNLYD